MLNDKIHCVIGSGPAGVSVAKGLLEGGAKVIMLDAGLKLDEKRSAVVENCSTKNFSDWTDDEIRTLKGGMKANKQGMPQKSLFGSDFPYRDTTKYLNWVAQNVDLRPSLALGGLSNTWGAAMLPFKDTDINTWPFNNDELKYHYHAVTKFTGLAGKRDDLENILPIYCDELGELKQSNQAEHILSNLNRFKTELNAEGWMFGQSRVGVKTKPNHKIGCTYCALCMHGCVYNCIYNSSYTVQELKNDNNFQYKNGIIVRKINENEDRVIINGFYINSGEEFKLEVDRVYLATGTISTAQILLRSLNRYEETIEMKDSQHFLVPILLKRGFKSLKSEAMHTLSQIFIEIDKSDISKRSIHLQLYTYNSTMSDVLKSTLGLMNGLSGFLESRLIVLQGYLHSDESGKIQITLKRDNKTETLDLKGITNPNSKRIIYKLMYELFKHSRKIGGVILPPLLAIYKPGHGYHSGGSMAMSLNPKMNESDLLGRPFGLKKVHVVDASILPSIPATTITFPVMANAHRIGFNSAKL